MVRTYGARATVRALSRAELLLHEGDAESHARWRRVSEMTRLLLQGEDDAVEAAPGSASNPG